MDLFSNPELIRNARAQLRPGKMLAAGICTLLVTSVIVVALTHDAERSRDVEAYRNALQTLMYLFTLALVMGGGGSCISSILREKEMNTFDFQRVTRLAPIELAFGKLLGAPAMTWFVGLCFLPAIIWTAAGARARPSFVLAAVVTAALGAVCVHSLCLMISLFMPRGTNPGAAMLLMLLFVPWAGNGATGEYFAVGNVNPGVATGIALQTSWRTDVIHLPDGRLNPRTGATDIFFGVPLHHVLVLALLYPAFIAWFLLAVSRNIKRDTDLYEAFTPLQSFGFLMFFNLLLVGFYRWQTSVHWPDPYPSLATFLIWNIFLLVIFGGTLLRSREQVRRLLRAGDGASALNIVWPAPLVVAGALIVGGAVIGMIVLTRSPKVEWSAGVSLYRVVFLGLWLARDFLYLQWMNLRRSRRSLHMGVVFLIVFYACTGILMSVVGGRYGEGALFWSAFLPGPVFELTAASFRVHPIGWTMLLFLQVALAAVFAILHRSELKALGSAPHS